MLGTKLYKNNKSDIANYTKTAIWCNANDAHIEDKGSYYEVCENVVPEPTIDEQLAELDSNYNTQKASISKQYTSAMMVDDTELASELKAELITLNEWYDEEYEKITGGAEV